MTLIDIAASIISGATRRVETSAQNIANMTTPGYKARREFPSIAASNAIAEPGGTIAANYSDFTTGKLSKTGSPFDLALTGPGFFVVRSADSEFYTRDGQFSRGADGRLMTPDGLALQGTNGDVTVSASAKVLADGTVIDGGQPVARLAVADFSDLKSLRSAGGSLFFATDASRRDLPLPTVEQGALETSNVSTADEMITMMASLRSAEMGQHVVQTYDDLMGRVLTTFGQS